MKNPFKRIDEPLATAPETNNITELDDSVIDAQASNTVEQGLDKTRNSLFGKLGNLFKGTFDLTDSLFEELEETLIASDIGVEASLNLVDRLQQRVIKDKIHNAAGVIQSLQDEISELLEVAEQPWPINHRPYVILMVGVNGTGKTTTTAKIAHRLQQQGKSVILAAADTFRAAAVEQLEMWGQRLDIPVISQKQGADAAAVAHDALSAAIARNSDVLLIDTAGRLHTQSELMEQLQKVARVVQKVDPTAPHEVMQVLDAGTGQNALLQLEHFQKAVAVSSISLTKLDGSARGGVALALTEKFKLPIRFIGIGERFADLRPFNATEFARAIIASDDPRNLS